MPSRLLARAAALVLVLGGLLAIPAGPASAHCADHSEHPDRYDRGGIDYGVNGTPLRRYPHVDCDVHIVIVQGNINVHCAREVPPPGTNDWVYLRDTIGGQHGWAREGQLNVPNPVLVEGCANGSNLVFIQQNP